MKPFLCMIVGLPTSGKTTLYKISEDSMGSHEYLSSDDYIEKKAASLGLTYDAIFADTISEANAWFFSELKAAVAAGKNIVVDRTFLTKKSRKAVLDLVPQGYHKSAVVFDAPSIELFEERNNRPGKTIPKHVFESMSKNYVLPSFDEGFDMIVSFDNFGNRIEVRNAR